MAETFNENPLERRILLIDFIRIWILKQIYYYVVPSMFWSVPLPLFLSYVEEGPLKVTLKVMFHVSVDSTFPLTTSFVALNFKFFIDLSVIKVTFSC